MIDTCALPVCDFTFYPLNTGSKEQKTNVCHFDYIQLVDLSFISFTGLFLQPCHSAEYCNCSYHEIRYADFLLLKIFVASVVILSSSSFYINFRMNLCILMLKKSFQVLRVKQ